MNNEKIIESVRCFCLQEELLTLERPLRVAAAVSGGADSMALLGILQALQPEFGFTLSACHVNHGLRGETADRDEAFVRAECARLGVPLRVFHAAELADAVGLPTEHAGEDWARRLRYACFERLCKEGIDCIATAHTANDQAETLLLRLARGTGLHGAGGIRPKRGCYLRPLLELTRRDTEDFCRGAGLEWVTDETNETDAYARNRLRHAALPTLQTTNSAAVENLARFCERAAQADAYFKRKAEELLSIARLDAAQAAVKNPRVREALSAGEPVWRLEPLAAADELILESVMHLLTSPVRDAEEKYIRLLCGIVRQGSGAVQLTDRVRFCAGNGFFWREEQTRKPEMTTDAPPEKQPFCPEKQAETLLPGGWKVTAAIFPADFEEKIQVVHKKDLKNRADYARITTLYTGLVLRGRQPGDRFRPVGRGVTKELRKWMNEAGIPPCQREHLPVLAAGSEVLWVCGGGFAEGLAPGGDTAQVLQLETEKMEEIDHEHAR